MLVLGSSHGTALAERHISCLGITGQWHHAWLSLIAKVSAPIKCGHLRSGMKHPGVLPWMEACGCSD